MRPTLLITIVALLAATSCAAELKWHKTLNEAKADAEKAGRAIFVATLWKKGV